MRIRGCEGGMERAISKAYVRKRATSWFAWDCLTILSGGRKGKASPHRFPSLSVLRGSPLHPVSSVKFPSLKVRSPGWGAGGTNSLEVVHPLRPDSRLRRSQEGQEGLKRCVCSACFFKQPQPAAQSQEGHFSASGFSFFIYKVGGKGRWGSKLRH